MSAPPSRNEILLNLFITVFLDVITLGFAFTIFPVLLLGEHGMLPAATSYEMRAITYGVLTAVYPMFQFFGAPILGALSDHHGRRPILLLSLAGTWLSYIVSALAITQGNLWLLLIARAVDGFTGGNISVAQSVIADVSTGKARAKSFGLIGMAFGFGFIVGPFLAGIFSSPDIVSWFTLATPFWVATGLTAINIILVALRLPETLHERKETPFSLTVGIRNIVHGFQMPRLRMMFLVIFLVALGFNFFTQFFQIYLIQKFDFTQREIGYLFGFIGIWIAFTQGVLLRPLANRYEPASILRISIVGMSAALFSILLPQAIWQLLIVMPLVAITRGLTHPNEIAIIADIGGSGRRGELLGINQSITSLAMMAPPLIGGVLTSLDPRLPLITASILTLTGWLVFVLSVRCPQHHHG